MHIWSITHAFYQQKLETSPYRKHSRLDETRSFLGFFLAFFWT